MEQLTLFTPPAMPTWDRLREVAKRWGIKTTRADRHDPKDLFMRTMHRVGFEKNYYLRCNLGTDNPVQGKMPIEDFDAFMFFDYYEPTLEGIR